MSHQPVFVGIAGGSGSGKSTLCASLVDRYSDLIGLIQLDDYFKRTADVPTINGMTNWETPDALDLDRLVTNLCDLQQGKAVTVLTKNERLNPDFQRTQQRIPIQVKPKKIMLVEGYLVLWDERIRDLLSTSIWLDVDHKTRWSRRVHFKNDDYERKVMIPMSLRFAESTKHYAEHIIDVTSLEPSEVFTQVNTILSPLLR